MIGVAISYTEVVKDTGGTIIWASSGAEVEMLHLAENTWGRTSPKTKGSRERFCMVPKIDFIRILIIGFCYVYVLILI